METAEILHQFERATGRFARAAVEAAVARREEVIPELLRTLQDTVDRTSIWTKSDESGRARIVPPESGS